MAFRNCLAAVVVSIGLGLVSGVLADVNKPTPPATKPATPTVKPPETKAPVEPKVAPRGGAAGGQAAVQQSVTALLQEYQKAVKNKGEGLREKSDYFAKDKPAGITNETILAALERSLDRDRRADAYVKWQLLSGTDAKIPDPLLSRAYRIYQNAPQPIAHPGLNRNMLDRALSKVGLQNQDAEPEINAEYAKAIAEYRLSVDPVLDLRDELYSRLPPGFDTFVAGLGDLYGRVSAGAPANGFWTTISSGLRSWGMQSKNGGQLRQLALAIRKLSSVVKDDRNRPYGKVTWQDSNNFRGLRWQPESTIQQENSLEETALWLEERAANPEGTGGGMFGDLKEKGKGKK